MHIYFNMLVARFECVFFAVYSKFCCILCSSVSFASNLSKKLFGNFLLKLAINDVLKFICSLKKGMLHTSSSYNYDVRHSWITPGSLTAFRCHK